MKAVTKVPTKYTKWMILNEATNKVTYTSTDKTSAVALVVGNAFVSHIKATQRGDALIRLASYSPKGVEDVAVCYGIVDYNGRTCGKMIDKKTHKKYLADIVNGQRINKGWSTYDSIF